MQQSPSPTTHPDLGEAPALTAAHLGKIARKHLLLVIACWLTVILATVAFSLSQQKYYRAEALLRLDPDPPKPLGTRVEVIGGSSSPWNRKEFYESEYRVMRSLRVAIGVVRALGLQNDPGFLGLASSSKVPFKPVSVEDAAELLIRRLSVDPVKESSLAMLRYEDTDPVRAKLILSATVRLYLAQNLEANASVSDSAADWLKSQLDGLKASLEKSEVALNDFRQKNNVLSISLEDRHNLITAQLESIAKEMTTLEIKRFELSARNLEISGIKGDDPTNVGATELLQSTVLATLRTSYAEQQRNLEELSSSLGDLHPKVVSARAKLDSTKRSINAEIGNIKTALARDLRSIDRQIGDLKKKDEEVQKVAHELQAFEIPYNQLSRTKTNNEKIYGLVLERSRETDLTRVMQFNNIRVVDDATSTKAPVRPNVPMNVAVGTVAGLLLGLALAFLREFSDRSVKTPADVESTLGTTCLGLLPEIDSRDRGIRRSRSSVAVSNLSDRDLVVAAHPESGVAEAARAIRTNLTFMSPDEPFRTLLVTSPLPQEGKTTVACSIATVLAQSSQRVLLVDTDLRRPRLHRTFHIPNDVGVTLAIAGQATIDECVRSTDIPNLYVLTSGPIPPNPAELLQSERFRKLVDELTAKFDRVIFDSPPLLPVTDAAILSRLVDGALLIIRGYRTQQHAARQALRMLRDVKANIIGVVLNAIDLNRSDYREYYYYRRSGYYADAPAPDDGRA